MLVMSPRSCTPNDYSRGHEVRRIARGNHCGCRLQKPRCMGFVGYRTEAEAVAAAKYFNGTYMDTSRLSVEVCTCSSVTAGIAVFEPRLSFPGGEASPRRVAAATVVQILEGVTALCGGRSYARTCDTLGSSAHRASHPEAYEVTPAEPRLMDRAAGGEENGARRAGDCGAV